MVVYTKHIRVISLALLVISLLIFGCIYQSSTSKLQIIPKPTYNETTNYSNYSQTNISQNDLTVQTNVTAPIQSNATNISSQMQRGTVDKNLYVEIYKPEKVWNGTTIFADGHNQRIVEVNMLGEVLWEYKIPSELMTNKTAVGLDVERLSNNNILFVLSNSGVYEIDRNDSIVWSYKDPKVSHDADRLPNGNTLVVFDNDDKKSDAQVKEVDSSGKIVWQWFAKDVYGTSKYKDIEMQGWTHANAVQRLSDGTTMVSLRNFYLTVIVDKDGKIVKEFDWSSFGNDTDPHEPEIHEKDGTLLVCLQNDAPYVAVGINMSTNKTLWTYSNSKLRTARDCDRLPNGNVLIVAVDKSIMGEESVMLEVTPTGEVVWRLDLKNVSVSKSPGWFYKADRISQ